ncbi:sigma-70 family RNA polymerase sigma factor [Skermanella rosea]|uniref:RNA polymerase sigma factor n=1 Tax=Skermanella rosea TaxID=1817965 RepID=UPI0019311BC4|nr:sigma-70 family RNA polymerase sigma factor [Skermanella rosea]UEM04782.1 sigma-70 family RNA polymerase sigma factor [Skermanella rosea]
MDDTEWLIAREVPGLRRYARALVRDRDRADDLVQECLERALRKQHLWRQVGSIRGWLLRILYNVHINLIRHHRRTPETTPLEDISVTQPARQFGHMQLQEMARALDDLPAPQRETLLLVVLEGLSYEEAACVLDVPIGTVRSRMSRAREALQSLNLEETRPAAVSPVTLRRVK